MNESTRREIEKVAWQTLRYSGITEPPVSLETLLDFLELHREFYDLQNPSFLDKAKHKIRVNGRKIGEIIKRIRLQAVLFYDQNPDRT